MTGGRTKCFVVVLTRELEVLSILREGAKRGHGGRERFCRERGEGGGEQFQTHCFPIL